MKAMVLAAGVGSRLKHLTKSRPKCLMEIGKSTMLEIVIERLKAAGVREIMINLHHLPDMITEYVKSKSSFGIDVSFSYEKDLLDTGGGIKRVRSFFQEEDLFLVHNSDVFSELDLNELIQFHRNSRALATLPVMSRESRRGLYFDSQDQLVGWTGENIQPPAGARLLAFSGMHALSGSIFKYMGEKESFSIIEPYLVAARAGERVLGYQMQDVFWLDMGTPEDLEELRRRVV